MCDSSWAASHGKNFWKTRRNIRLCCIGGIFCRLRGINDIKEFICAGCGEKLFGECLVQQKNRKLAQYVYMNIVFCVRCGNKEHKLDFLAVGSVIIHTRRHCHSGQSWSLYAVALAVRNCDTFAHCSCAFLLTGKHSFVIDFNIRNLSACIHKLYNLLNGIIFA